MVLFIFFNFHEKFALASEILIRNLANNYIYDILKGDPSFLKTTSLLSIAELSNDPDQGGTEREIISKLGLKGNIEHLFALPFILNITLEIIIPSMIDNKSDKIPLTLNSNLVKFNIKNIDDKLNFRKLYLSFGYSDDKFFFFYNPEYQKLITAEKKTHFFFQIIKNIKSSDFSKYFGNKKENSLPIPFNRPDQSHYIKLKCVNQSVDYNEFYSKIIKYNIEKHEIFVNSKSKSLICPYCYKGMEKESIKKLLSKKERTEICTKILEGLYQLNKIDKMTFDTLLLDLKTSGSIFLPCINGKEKFKKFKKKVIELNSRNPQIVLSTNYDSYTCPFCNKPERFMNLCNQIPQEKINNIINKINKIQNSLNIYSQNAWQNQSNNLFMQNQSVSVPILNNTNYLDSMSNFRTRSDYKKEGFASHLKVHSQHIVDNKTEFFEKLMKVNLFDPEFSNKSYYTLFKCPECSIYFTKVELEKILFQNELDHLIRNLQFEYHAKNPPHNEFDYFDRKTKSYSPNHQMLSNTMYSSQNSNIGFNQFSDLKWHCNTGNDSRSTILKKLIKHNKNKFKDYTINEITFLECYYCKKIMFNYELLKYLNSEELSYIKEKIIMKNHKSYKEKSFKTSVILKEDSLLEKMSKSGKLSKNNFFNQKRASKSFKSHNYTDIQISPFSSGYDNISISCLNYKFNKSSFSSKLISANISNPNIFQKSNGTKFLCLGCNKKLHSELLEKIFTNWEISSVANEIKKSLSGRLLNHSNFGSIGFSNPSLGYSNALPYYFHCCQIFDKKEILFQKIIDYNIRVSSKIMPNEPLHLFCPFCNKKVLPIELENHFNPVQIKDIENQIFSYRKMNESNFYPPNGFSRSYPYDYKDLTRSLSLNRMGKYASLHCDHQEKLFENLCRDIIDINRAYPLHWVTKHYAMCPNCKSYMDLYHLLNNASPEQFKILQSKLDFELNQNYNLGRNNMEMNRNNNPLQYGSMINPPYYKEDYPLSGSNFSKIKNRNLENDRYHSHILYQPDFQSNSRSNFIL